MSTTFEDKWGVDLHEFAHEEGVSDVAIRMRIHNFNSPFQRTGRPNSLEANWGLTITEIAKREGINTFTVRSRVSKYGTPFVNLKRQRNSCYNPRPGEKVIKSWFHPLHPSYDNWQARCAVKQGAIQYVDV